MVTLILAETDQALRAAHRSYLARHGFQVETVEDGLECVAKLRELVPDLLVLDLDLPWGGGDGVLGMMREDPRLHPVQVVLTSTVTGRRAFADLISPPVIKTLNKPFPLTSLLEACALGSRGKPCGLEARHDKGAQFIARDHD